MQSYYPKRFEREVGFSLADWERTLGGALVACEARAVVTPGVGASVKWALGELELRWTLLEPRQIALVRLPRLQVSFAFESADDAGRQRFMRLFDLYMQRGGG